MNIAEIMQRAEEVVAPYSGKLGSATIQDIGQDAVMAVWEASERGETLDIGTEVKKRAEREWKHVRQDQGIRTVPLEDVAEWLPAVNTLQGGDSGEFGRSSMSVPGVARVTPLEMVMEAAGAAGAAEALWGWLDSAQGGKRHSVSPRLASAVRDELPAVLAWWAHRGRSRCAEDWTSARAMAPTTELVQSPAEISDSQVSHYAREGKPRLRPTPVRVHTSDPESDGLAMLSFGPGAVRKPSRKGKREGQATVSLTNRNRWADVGNRAG